MPILRTYTTRLNELGCETLKQTYMYKKHIPQQNKNYSLSRYLRTVDGGIQDIMTVNSILRVFAIVVLRKNRRRRIKKNTNTCMHNEWRRRFTHFEHNPATVFFTRFLLLLWWSRKTLQFVHLGAAATCKRNPFILSLSVAHLVVLSWLFVLGFGCMVLNVMHAGDRDRNRYVRVLWGPVRKCTRDVG